MSLKGKVAVVTGASRGIGKAIAMKLAREGADLVVTATSLEGAQLIADDLIQMGAKAMAVKVDVASSAEVAELFAKVIAEFGRLDILVNNAGITKDGLLLRMKDEEWDAVINVNLKGTFNCTREAVKIMAKARSGRIINISSVVGEMGNAGQTNYCASKAGIIGFTKSAAREFAKRNVTVNAITPGFIATEMTDVLSDKVKEELQKQIPMERFGAPEDIANAVYFLASDLGSYITGHVLSVNGGMYM